MTETLLTQLSRYTERGLELGGPKDFGYSDMKNVSVASTYYDPPRVTEMYRERNSH